MTALTKAEMADHLSEKTGLNRREAKQLVELFFEEISQALIAGDQVKLSGFGNFELRDKRQRPGRNPKTGEEIPITARRVVTFRAGQKFRQRVEQEQYTEEQVITSSLGFINEQRIMLLFYCASVIRLIFKSTLIAINI